MCMESAFNNGTSCFKPINIPVYETAQRSSMRIWAWHPSIRITNLFTHWQSLGQWLGEGAEVQVREGMVGHMGMYDETTNVLTHATPRGVVRDSGSQELRDYLADGSEILGYVPAIALSPQREADGVAFLESIVGKVYGWDTLAQYIVLDAAHALSLVLNPLRPIVDLLEMFPIGSLDILGGYLCFQEIGDWLIRVGLWTGNAKRFNPRRLQELVDTGVLKALGPQTLATPTGEGGWQRC